MQTVLHIVCLKFACSVTIASEFMIVSICRKYVVAAAAAFSIHFTPFLLFSCCLVGIRIRSFLYCSLSIYFEISRLVCCVLHTSRRWWDGRHLAWKWHVYHFICVKHLYTWLSFNYLELLSRSTCLKMTTFFWSALYIK